MIVNGRKRKEKERRRIGTKNATKCYYSVTVLKMSKKKKKKENNGRKKRELIIVNNKATYVYIRIGIREHAS